MVSNGKSLVIKNAIEEIKYKDKPKDKINLIYHTTPWRGLSQLLKVFKNLKLDNVELNICSSTKIYGEKFNSKMGKNYEKLFEECKATKNVNYFESLVTDKVYFNPKESVGVGTVVGISSSMTFEFGDSSITRDVLTQRIYIENHPFITNQPVNLIVPAGGAISISNTSSSTPYDLPISGVTTTVYVVRKTINSIGIISTNLTNCSRIFSLLIK